MSASKRNQDFVGKLWKIGTKYIFVDYVQKPKVRKDGVKRSYSYSDTDESREYYSNSNFVSHGCSKICGKNEYNQYVAIELTPERRKEAIETSWDEYLVAGID